MARPAGHRIMIRVDDTEEVTKGGVVLSSETVLKESRAIDKGVVVALGATAYKDFTGEPWVKVGDKVWFKKYAGLKVDDCNVIIEDEDIYAIED